jgi:hypothetical protein
LTAPCGTTFDSGEFFLYYGGSRPDGPFDARGVATEGSMWIDIGKGFRFLGLSSAGVWRMEVSRVGPTPNFNIQRHTPLNDDGTPVFPPPPPVHRIVPPPERQKLWLQLGANSNQGMNVTLPTINTRVLGGAFGDLSRLINVVSRDGKQISGQLRYIDYAINRVNKERARLGAYQNRLEHTSRSLLISSENLQDAESRIRNADIAREMMKFTKANILMQVGIIVLAQANQKPNMLLRLLR